MKEKIKKEKGNQFNHQLIDDIKTCLFTFVILVIFVLLYFLLEPLLGVAATVIFGFLGVIVAGAFYYFITRLIRIIGWLFRKKKWTNFGES